MDGVARSLRISSGREMRTLKIIAVALMLLVINQSESLEQVTDDAVIIEGA